MEYCVGDNLQKWLDDRRVATKDLDDDTILKDNKLNAFTIFEQMLEGIISMHENKIVHRDLKPQNIFMDNENRIKIGDFGLAKAAT